MVNKKEVDKRELWQKLLDPIREAYGTEPSCDLELLRRVIFDHQVLILENAKLNRAVTEQARILRKHGWGGY